MQSQAWIASTTYSALGGDNSGLSYLSPEYGDQTLKQVLDARGKEFLGEDHVARWGNTPGFLLKLLHSRDRLLVQVHPSKEMAKKYFASPFGKAEAWYVLDVSPETRAVIYAGFKPWVTRELFEELIRAQDTQRILECLHCFEVKAGDVIYIAPGLPHALGAGFLVAEIQEPTDITLRAERIRPDGTVLPEQSLHSGIGYEGLLDCFSFRGADWQTIAEQIFVRPKVLSDTGTASERLLIGGEQTPCFSMRLTEVRA